jgi:hypothetical protein
MNTSINLNSNSNINSNSNLDSRKNKEIIFENYFNNLKKGRNFINNFTEIEYKLEVKKNNLENNTIQNSIIPLEINESKLSNY